MKAGQMRHVITVQRMVSGLDEHGGATEAWADFAGLRASIGPIEQVEKQGADGAQDWVSVVFQTRILAGTVSLADQVIWLGKPYQIKSLSGGLAMNDGQRLHCEGRL